MKKLLLLCLACFLLVGTGCGDEGRHSVDLPDDVVKEDLDIPASAAVDISFKEEPGTESGNYKSDISELPMDQLNYAMISTRFVNKRKANDSNQYEVRVEMPDNDIFDVELVRGNGVEKIDDFNGKVMYRYYADGNEQGPETLVEFSIIAKSDFVTEEEVSALFSVNVFEVSSGAEVIDTYERTVSFY